MDDASEKELFHWEHREDENDGKVHVIVCDQPDCDWEGTAYGSQFVVHHSRDHDDKPSAKHESIPRSVKDDE